MDMKAVKEVNNLGFSKEKTEELISNLKADGVTVGIENLADYIRKQGLIVKLHIGRKRNYVEISPKLFGVDLSQKGEELNEFFKQHLQMGKVKFIPDVDEKVLVNIESALRMTRKRNTIGYDDSFMTISLYEEFMEVFKAKKEAYFESRNRILDKWDVLIQRFKEILYISLNELHSIDSEKVFAHIISKLPSKEDYANSFYMTVTATAFPVTENLDMFSDDIKSQIKEGLNQETIETLYDIIGNTLNDAFQNVCKVLATVQKNDKIVPKTLGSIKKTAQRVGEKNIFNNPKIDELKKDILHMIKQGSNIAVMTELAENILAKVYGYAKELGIDSHLDLKDCPLSEDELLDTYGMLVDEESYSEEVQGEAFSMMSA